MRWTGERTVTVQEEAGHVYPHPPTSKAHNSTTAYFQIISIRD